MINEELEDLCFELGEKKEELVVFIKERLENVGDINFFIMWGMLRNVVICEFLEFLVEVNEFFMEIMCIVFVKKVFKVERKVFFFYCWL